jgi:aspartate/methionine/tyrosine aminotransferase
MAYFHVVMATCDPGDEVVLLAPYYFNHFMALQLTNVKPVIVNDFVGKEAHNEKVC